MLILEWPKCAFCIAMRDMNRDLSVEMSIMSIFMYKYIWTETLTHSLLLPHRNVPKNVV